jgi:hypothetical protein
MHSAEMIVGRRMQCGRNRLIEKQVGEEADRGEQHPRAQRADPSDRHGEQGQQQQPVAAGKVALVHDAVERLRRAAAKRVFSRIVRRYGIRCITLFLRVTRALSYSGRFAAPPTQPARLTPRCARRSDR